MEPERSRRARFLHVRLRLPISPPHHAGEWKDRQWSSRVLHRLGEMAALSTAGVCAGLVVFAWWIVGAAARFPPWWATTLYSVTASVTFVMVFVIQHTQARQTLATQRKLDELIRASTHADNSLIAVEESSDGHLHQLTELTVAELDWPVDEA